MEWVWIILGIILCIIGIIGSLLPLLPGPPIAYVGILLQLFRNPDPFDAKTYWIFGGVVVVTLVLDYLIPIWGTKKIWWHQVWCMGMHDWLSCSILVRSCRNYHRPICGSFRRRIDRGKRFKELIKICNRFLCWFPGGIVFKNCCLLFYALLDHREYLK